MELADRDHCFFLNNLIAEEHLAVNEFEEIKKGKKIKRKSTGRSAQQTGDLKLKIFTDRTSNSKLWNSPVRSKKWIEIDQVVENCPSCDQDFTGSISSSVFCLKTGNVTVTCQNQHCRTVTCMKNIYKIH